MNSNDTFKFYYFKANGRGALIKAELCYGKVNWENNYIDHKDWPTIKKSGLCEFEQVPILVHNDKKLSQSAAIYLYLARLFNIYGKNIEEQYQIDSLLCTIEDINPHFYAVIMPRTEEQKNKPEEFKKILREKMVQYLTVFENRYKALGSHKYFLGDTFTMADLFLAVQISSYQLVLKEDLMKEVAPGIHKIVEEVKQNELKEYFEKYFIQ